METHEKDRRTLGFRDQACSGGLEIDDVPVHSMMAILSIAYNNWRILQAEYKRANFNTMKRFICE